MLKETQMPAQPPEWNRTQQQAAITIKNTTSHRNLSLIAYTYGYITFLPFHVHKRN